MNKTALSFSSVIVAIGLLAGCTTPSNPEAEKAMADHGAMLKADSATKAEAAQIACSRKVAAMFNTGDTEGIEDCVAGSVVDHTAQPGATTGIQGLKDAIAMMRGAYPDLQWTVINMVAEGDMVYG